MAFVRMRSVTLIKIATTEWMHVDTEVKNFGTSK